jgi:two-component system sensor histidine kinase YesM
MSDGILTVTLESDGEELRIVIEDNGVGMSEDELMNWHRKLASNKVNAEVSGIINVHRRLQLKFGDESGISLSPRLGGGLKVTMKIQLRKGKE